MSLITTHVLDTALGRPASDIPVFLEFLGPGSTWVEVAAGTTDLDGRITDLLPNTALSVGIYRMTFETGKYFEELELPSFYPYVQVIFQIVDTAQKYHVPLLLSPFGFSTYRGSDAHGTPAVEPAAEAVVAADDSAEVDAVEAPVEEAADEVAEPGEESSSDEAADAAEEADDADAGTDEPAESETDEAAEADEALDAAADD